MSLQVAASSAAAVNAQSQLHRQPVSARLALSVAAAAAARAISPG